MWFWAGLACAAPLVLGAHLGIAYLTGNFHEVIAGELYRSAQPTASQIAGWQDRYGIRTIVNLRGPNPGRGWYEAELAEAKARGISVVDVGISAKHELDDKVVEHLLDTFASAERPILIHCSSGADRSGLASALYLAAIAKSTEAAAEAQLSLYYGHIPLWFVRAQAMDRTFERLEPRLGYPDS